MAMSAGAGGFSQGNHNVFVYGSLLSDEVVHVLLNRVPASSPAILPHYQRFSIKGRVYPAILPFENSKVLGRVLTGVTNLELDILDDFEDDEYVRDSVEVTLVDDSEKLQAYTYVWVNKDDPYLSGDWDFEKWRAAHMNDFIEMTKEFVEELEQPESKSRVETYDSFYRSSDDKSTSA